MNELCRECETAAHCSFHGCIPLQDAEELSADATSSLFLALLYIVGAVLAAAVILLPLFYGFPR